MRQIPRGTISEWLSLAFHSWVIFIAENEAMPCTRLHAEAFAACRPAVAGHFKQWFAGAETAGAFLPSPSPSKAQGACPTRAAPAKKAAFPPRLLAAPTARAGGNGNGGSHPKTRGARGPMPSRAGRGRDGLPDTRGMAWACAERRRRRRAARLFRAAQRPGFPSSKHINTAEAAKGRTV